MGMRYSGRFYAFLGVGLIVFLAVLFRAGSEFTNYSSRRVQYEAANAELFRLSIALDEYKHTFDDYPPDNYPSDNGSEILWYYLCREHSSGGKTYGPFLMNARLSPSDRLATRKYLSPFGGEYCYVRNPGEKREGTAFNLIDPGPDRKLGGVLDREKGFIVYDKKVAADNLNSWGLERDR